MKFSLKNLVVIAMVLVLSIATLSIGVLANNGNYEYLDSCCVAVEDVAEVDTSFDGPQPRGRCAGSCGGWWEWLWNNCTCSSNASATFNCRRFGTSDCPRRS